MEVLELLAGGRGIKAIAKELGVSERTIDWHLQSARRTLAAESSTHAVAIAIEEGHIHRR